MSGHFDGELWGVACHPKQLKCVTCGGDSYLRLWDLETKKLLQVSKVFENDIRGVDWASNEQFLAVGDVKGFIYLVDATNLTVLDKKNSKFA
jgi:microtubule-associated protein-like 6